MKGYEGIFSLLKCIFLRMHPQSRINCTLSRKCNKMLKKSLHSFPKIANFVRELTLSYLQSYAFYFKKYDIVSLAVHY